MSACESCGGSGEVPEYHDYATEYLGCHDCRGTGLAPTGGEDAIRREVEACEDEERERFRKKLAHWREHGAPPYHGPKAVK